MVCAKQLRREFDASNRDRNPGVFWENLREGLDKGHLNPEEFSFAELFEEFVEGGRELRSSFNPRNSVNGYDMGLLESSGAVTTSSFTHITGQIMISTVLSAFNDPALIGDQLVTTINTKLDGEMIPGISRIGDAAEEVGENDDYPIAGLSEEYIETPRTIKRGFIVPLSKEAIFFDKTNLLISRASAVAKEFAINKEKRILDTVLGITTSYKRNGRNAVATYGNNSGDHDWDNLAASNGLVDWTDIETAELLFDGLTDPNTGEPILVQPNTIVLPSALKYTAKRIINATHIEHVDNQSAASTIRTQSSNPVGDFNILTNQYVKARTSSDTTWFMGDFKQAFLYMQNWPISVETQGATSEAAFTRDIVAQYKVSERGVPAVKEPRAAVKCTA